MAFSGDELRAAWFRGGGYDRAQVHDLLSRVADEIDAGRPAAPLIDQAALAYWTRGPGCDIDAVDWLLDQLRLGRDDQDADRMSFDAWRDLTMVAQLSMASRPQPSGWWQRIDEWQTHGRQRSANCTEPKAAWEGFSQLPGERLRWHRGELTADGQDTLAATTRTRWLDTYRELAVAGKRYSFDDAIPSRWRTPSPEMAEIAARSARDYAAITSPPRRGR